MSKPRNLPERVEATDLVFKRFRDRAFDWKTTATCIHLARSQIIAMGGTAPPIAQFRSPLGAKKALKKLGHDSLLGLLDEVLPDQRIAPAAMLVGDLGLMPGEDGLGAIVICGGQKVFGWHGDDLSRMQVIEVGRDAFEAAWRL